MAWLQDERATVSLRRAVAYYVHFVRAEHGVLSAAPADKTVAPRRRIETLFGPALMHAILPSAWFNPASDRVDSISRSRRELAPVVIAVVVSFLTYLAFASTAVSPTSGEHARDAYYNRLVDGLLAGHLSLDKPVPKALAALPDPYDPAAVGAARGLNYTPSSVHDLSYFQGRLYLYFSVIPAVLVFLPYHALTGAYLAQQYACVLFMTAGLAFAARVIVAVWRESFARVHPHAVGVLTLAAGLAPFSVVLIQRPDVYEVPIAAAFFFTSATMYGVWRIARQPPSAVWPLALLSACVGCAVGCRPSEVATVGLLLFAGAFYWRNDYNVGRRRWQLLVATGGPIAVIAAALLAFNYARFGAMAEFGARYQLNLDATTVSRFNVANLTFNGWMYFLHFPGWSAQFPFAGPWHSDWPPPSTIAGIEHPLGLIPAAPFVCCGLIALAHWRRWTLAVRSVTLTCLWIAATNAFVLCLFVGNASRYQMAFGPPLILVAIFGVLSLEVALASCRPFVRGVGRAAWVGALAASVAYGMLFAYRLRGEAWLAQGVSHMVEGDLAAAIDHCDRALGYDPASVEALKVRAACEMRFNRLEDAGRDLQAVVDRDPEDAVTWSYLGAVFMSQPGHRAEAIIAFRRALALTPNRAGTHYNLARALLNTGERIEAVRHLRAALRLDPSLADARQLLLQVQ
jgi:tetratricopeptide (TPR) repeat protein